MNLLDLLTIVVLFLVLPAAIGYTIEYREEPPKDM